MRERIGRREVPLRRDSERATAQQQKDAAAPVGMTILRKLEVEGGGVGYAGASGVAAFDAADAEKFFAAALEVGFDGFYVGGRDDEDHADAHVERLQEFIGFNAADFS